MKNHAFFVNIGASAAAALEKAADRGYNVYGEFFGSQFN